MKKLNNLKYYITLIVVLAVHTVVAETISIYDYTIASKNDCLNQWGETCGWSVTVNRRSIEGTAKCTPAGSHNICSYTVGENYINTTNWWLDALDALGSNP